jgi:hypothetical protein
MGGKRATHDVRAREEREQQTESILKEDAIFLALFCANNLSVSTLSHTRSAIALQ